LAVRLTEDSGELRDAGVDLGEDLLTTRVRVHEVRGDEPADHTDQEPAQTLHSAILRREAPGNPPAPLVCADISGLRSTRRRAALHRSRGPRRASDDGPGVPAACRARPRGNPGPGAG